MHLLEWFTTNRAILLDSGLAAVSVALACAPLSVLVVLKRLAFVGQGVSHSALGGIGLAAVLGLYGASGWLGAVGSMGVVMGFCMLAALAMSMSGHRAESARASQTDLEADSAIGVVLVASMALGALLLSLHINQGIGRRGGSGSAGYEAIFFGSMLQISRSQAVITASISLAMLLVMWWVRRPMILWAFDAPAAAAAGVPVRRLNVLLMILLAVATVTAMRVLGVVLATALLILPGAASLRLFRGFLPVTLGSAGIAVVGVVAGTLISLETSWPAGSTIVLMLTGLLVVASVVGRVRRG